MDHIDDVQRLIDCELKLQFAMGDVLRDLAVMMRLREQGKSYDDLTYQLVMEHIQNFRIQLDRLEGEARRGADGADAITRVRT